MAREQLPAHIKALQNPSAYPKPVRAIELVQTHISFVFLVDHEVYKLKKPVDLGFANFTTLARRKAACEAEVRLNLRGSPSGVYLGVEPVVRSRRGYRIGGRGELVDYAVHMKRLPQDRMMDRLLERDEVDFGMVGRLAGRVAEMHENAERGPKITRTGGSKTLARNWRDTLETMRDFTGRSLGESRLQRIEAYATAFLQDEAALLRRRDDEGWVRDCHGDMRTDSVCFDESLPGGLCIYDCIEFNDAFRYGDTGLDVAFLAMDLDYRGRPDLSDLFIGLYSPLMADIELPLLLNFYKCYRACVRGKVESLLSVDRHAPQRTRSVAKKRAQAYFRLADSYARRKQTRGVFLVGGPSGSGKSVLAGALASRIGAALLSTDALRRHMFDQARRGADVNEGKYTDEGRAAVYREMERRAAELIAAGRPAVLDATFVWRRIREPFIKIAREARRPLIVVECTAPADVIRQRQQQRQGESWSVSEGRYEVYLEQKASYEPPDEVAPREHVLVDTTRPLEDNLTLVTRSLPSSARRPRRR